jgi:hypothetical protein
MTAKTRVDNKMNRFMAGNETAMERALTLMRVDIFVLSQFKVPYEGGELQDSGEHKRIERLHHRVQYGEKGAQEYAGFQHRGMRKDGSHRVKNYTTAGTNKNYLSDSGAIIAPRSGQYFRREASKVRV